MRAVMNAYAQLIDERVGTEDVVMVAAAWGVPPWVIYDARRGRAKKPSIQHLTAIAAGCGMTVEQFLERIAPPKENGRRAPGGRRGSGKATASIS